MPQKKNVKKVKKTKVSKTNSTETPSPQTPSTKTSSTKTPSTKTPPTTPVVEVEIEEKKQVKQTTADITDNLFNTLQCQLVQLSDAGCQLPDFRKSLIVLKKSIDRERKEFVKSQPKKKKVSSGVKRAPSGFAKPTKISKELCKFLKVDVNTEISRIDVTRKISEYVKTNDLQDPKDRRYILPNDCLKKLLKVKGESPKELSYFNLQKHLNPHYCTA